MLRKCCALPLLLAALLSGPAVAEQSILQIDLLMVEQPSWVRSRDSGVWSLQSMPESDALAPQEIAALPDFEWLPGPDSAFAEQAQKLQESGYTPLYMASFRFPQTRLRNVTTWQISQGEPLTIAAEDPYLNESGVDLAWFDRPVDATPESLTPISGWVRSWFETYLFVEFDIARIIADSSLRQMLESDRPRWDQADLNSNTFAAPAFGSTSGNSGFAASGPGWSTADIWPREAVTMHRVNARKRVKLNEIHYFDHPQVGILIRVTEPSRNLPVEETP